MNNLLGDYQCQFSVEERKQLVAQMIQETRKAKKLTQKEVADAIGVKLPTYSTYETGRSEPPVEILVRLSFLFGVSLDILTQKERLYKDTKDLAEQLNTFKTEIAKAKEELARRGDSNPELALFVAGLENMLSATEQISQTEKARQQIDQIKP